MIRFALALTALLALAGPLRAAVEIQEVTTPGGITAWLVEEDAVPFTALEIHFRGGGSLDRDGKRGAVNLMTATLEEGAGDLDAQAFAVAPEVETASISSTLAPSTSPRLAGGTRNAPCTLRSRSLCPSPTWRRVAR